MAYPYRDQGYGNQSRPRSPSSPPVTHRRRSWNNNGVHHVFEISSFHSPMISIEALGSSIGSPVESIFPPNHPPSSRQGTGIIGTAFDLLGGAFAAQQQATEVRRAQAQRRTPIQPYVEDLAYCDDPDEEEEEPVPAPRHQGFVSKMTERLLNSSQRPRRSPFTREDSPIRQAPRRRDTERRAKPSYRTQHREPPWNDRAARVDEYYHENDDDDYKDCERPRRPRMRRAFTTNESDQLNIQALENAAEYHRRECRKYRKRLEQASRQPMSGGDTFQHLVDQFKSNETAYNNACEDLNMARAGADGHPMEPTPRRPGGRRSSRRENVARSYRDEPTHTEAQDEFDSFFQPRRQSHPLFADLDEFDPLQTFAETPFGAFNHLFAPFGPGSPFGGRFSFIPTANFERTRHSSGNGTRSQRPPRFSRFATAPSDPPANLLQPHEAKKLFEVYNERWNALSATDPNIPYPARGLQATALSLRDTIWAPYLRAPISSWSEDAVMQANTQAFFLGVVGLFPVYTENPGTGRIVMGFDKMQSTPDKIKELVDILKKEKTRWHSDRLGRRNGGISAEPNIALQRDERARAIFHAVCELMQTAQEDV